MANIDGVSEFGRRIFCNGIVPFTPKKSSNLVEDDSNEDTLATQSEKCPEVVVSTLDDEKICLEDEHQSVSSLVRRHSLSARSPHKGSIADELLNSPRLNLKNTQSMIEDIQNLTERLSDFASCVSSSDDEKTEGKLPKKKRKIRPSPEKAQSLKKPNIDKNKH